jgi:hypothetical protein
VASPLHEQIPIEASPSRGSAKICRRRVSRATWLWVGRESRATRASIRAVSWSMRIVSVPFM